MACFIKRVEEERLQKPKSKPRSFVAHRSTAEEEKFKKIMAACFQRARPLASRHSQDVVKPTPKTVVDFCPTSSLQVIPVTLAASNGKLVADKTVLEVVEDRKLVACHDIVVRLGLGF